MSTELTIIEQPKALELFEKGGIRDVIGNIRKEVLSIVTDPTTDKGRKEIASLAYKVARTKSALDEAGKQLTEDARKTVDRVNEERRFARTELDKLKDEVRRPLTEYEEREKARIARHEANISRFSGLLEVDYPTSGAADEAIKGLVAIPVDESYEEFQDKAETVKSEVRVKLTAIRDRLKKSEDERAELERLRKEKEERERKEREERLAREAAEKARRDAEEKAKREAEAERQRVETERQKERDRIQQMEREKQEAEARHRKAIEDERRKAREEADRKEQERKDAEEKARAEAEKKAANKRHRAKIMKEAQDSIDALSDRSTEGLVKAIAEGEIKHVTIQF